MVTQHFCVNNLITSSSWMITRSRTDWWPQMDGHTNWSFAVELNLILTFGAKPRKVRTMSFSSSKGNSLASTSHYAPRHGSVNNFNSGDTIILLVDGAGFVVDPEIFAAKKDSMLYRMFFSSPSIAKPNEKGQYVIEGFSAPVFQAILVCTLTTRKVHAE